MKEFLCLQVFLLLFHTGVGQITQINDNDDLYPVAYLSAQKVFLVDKGGHLWISDATKAGTIILSDSIAVAGDGVMFNGKFIFIGSTTATGAELFVSDGTAAGTKLMADIVPGPAGSDPGSNLVLFRGAVYFTATTVAAGRELWRTNGTAAGTAMVKDIFPGAESGIGDDAHFDMISTGSFLLFNARGNAAQGVELWRSDGTAAGTFMVKDIAAGEKNSNPEWFYPYKNMVLFTATTTENGTEIWKTDGTAAGTTILKDIIPGPSSSTTVPYLGFEVSVFHGGFHEFKGELFFNVNDGAGSITLFKTNGTTAGTVALKQLSPANIYSADIWTNAWNLGNKFVFGMGNPGVTSSLWECDGTAAGTKAFIYFTGADGYYPFIFPNYIFTPGEEAISYQLYKGRFFFSAPGDEGNELWWSNGTPAGTTIVKDIHPNGHGIAGNIGFMYTSGGFYFAATDGVDGNELWISDGTPTGTRLVKDINPSGDANPQFFLWVNNKILFIATDGNNEDHSDLFVMGGSFSPLPLELLSFQATENKDKVFLSWTTAAEMQTKDFVVEVSADLKSWTAIGEVAAAGISSAKKNYMYTDEQASIRGAAILYYRLKMRDLDSKFTYSNIATVSLRGAAWSAKLLSNPVKDLPRLALSGVQGKTLLTITDVSGKTLWTKRLESSGDIPVPVVLQRGMYILTVENGNQKKQLRFVKE